MIRSAPRYTALALFAFVAGLASGSEARAQTKAGEVYSYYATTPRPYPAGGEDRPVVWTDRVRSEGATWVRLHFRDFDLAPGDYVTIQDPGSARVHRYEGRGPYGNGDFWSFSVEGDTAIVRLHAGRNLGTGYTITEIGHGILAAEPVAEVVCGTDGRRDVVCYSDPAPEEFDPVARLLFQDGGVFYVCTGFLVDGANSSTLMTNNHCINSQAITSTLEATFNYQSATCRTGGGGHGGKRGKSGRGRPEVNPGPEAGPPVVYAGGTFLRTSPIEGGLDYTLLTLLGDPEADWGEYVATTVEPGSGSVMLLPQHPGGALKELGKFEDKAQTILCDVTAIHQTPYTTAFGSQFSYGCDSEGGSSGSPIMTSPPTRVWGIHNLGGINSCNNAGVHMSRICADAGLLLACSSTL